MEKVTARELEVLQLIAAGQSTKQVAFQLGIAFKTAASHRNRLIEKLEAANTADMICRAAQRGLIDVFALHSAESGSTPWNILARRIVSNRNDASQHRQALAAAVLQSNEILKRHRQLLDELQVAQDRTVVSLKELLGTFREREIRGAVLCARGS